MNEKPGDTTTGRVEAIYTAANAGDTPQDHDWIDAVAGRGLLGDRYYHGRGTFSTRSPIVAGSRVLSIIDTTTLDTCRYRLGYDLAAMDLRRNLWIDGLDIYALRGQMLTIGTVTIRMAGRCPPCGYLSRLLGADMRDALYRLGGMRAEILKSGTIHVGDDVRRCD